MQPIAAVSLLLTAAWLTLAEPGPPGQAVVWWLLPGVVRWLGGRNAALAACVLANSAAVMEGRVAARLSEPEHGNDVIVVGQVCSFPSRSDGVARFEFRLPDGAGLPQRILVADYGPAPPQVGESWQLKLRLRMPRGFANPGGYDAERQLLLRKVGARAYVRQSPENRPLKRHLGLCPLVESRGRIAAQLAEAIPPEHPAGHLLALVVGARHALTTSDWDLLRNTGTVHLMAISGLHISFVAGLGFWLARRAVGVILLTGVSLPVGIVVPVLVALAAAGYAALAGFALPTVRALLMLCLALGAWHLRRAVTPWQLLAGTLTCVLLLEPLAPLKLGFWLSFIAVAFLILPSMGRSPESARSATAQFLAAQLRVTLGLAAPLALTFSEWPGVSPLANLIAIPVVTLAVVPGALLGTLLHLNAWDPGLLWLAGEILAWLLHCLAWMENLEPVRAPLPLGGALAAVAGALVCVWPRPLPGRSAAAVVACAILVLSPSLAFAPKPALRVHVLDVGQGLAVLVRTARHALLYDAGPSYRGGDAGAAVVAPALKALGVTHLDLLVVSHGDADHAGGAASVAAELVVESHLGGDLPVPGSACLAPQDWAWDGIRFRILHPLTIPPAVDRVRNNDSCVLLIETPSARILLPGDIERSAELELLRREPNLAVDLVVAPHHGSATSSSQPFVRATRPRFVVFTTGYRNRWGFPRQPVVARWASAGACLLDTAGSGALEFQTDPQGRLVFAGGWRAKAPTLWRFPPAESGTCGPAGPAVKSQGRRL